MSKGLADQVLKIAVDAGRQIIAAEASGLAVDRKTDQSPVTNADMAAHRLIMARLSQLTPTIPIISEEAVDDDAVALATIKRSAKYWVVDPLDGTKGFLAGTGDFTVNIALVENGVPILGAIVAPAKGRHFIAEKGVGAVEVLDEGGFRRLSTRKTLRSSPTMLLSRHHPGGEAQWAKAAFPDSRLTPVGSSLKYAIIAAGEADVAIRRTPTKLWDLAAADAILSVAGGRIFDFSGEPLDYSGKTLVHPPFVALGDASFWSYIQPTLATLTKS